MKERRWNPFAFAWGFAEATLFFFVPDVLLSWFALERPRRAYVACVYALLGAIVGGTLMWWWGTSDVESARGVLDVLPGIQEAMSLEVNADLDRDGLRALAIGPLAGIPYKLFAVEWGALGGAWWPFFLVSVPARLVRFALVASVAVLVRSRRVGLSLAAGRRLHIALWVTFYAGYFAVMGV